MIKPYIKNETAVDIICSICDRMYPGMDCEPADCEYADCEWMKMLVEEAVDAVPVVRCKDCKHFKNYGKTSLLIDGKNIKAGWCQRRARYDEEYRMPPDGFCSYGERKEEPHDRLQKDL